MPRLDKTGPSGQGPMTGRAMGSCNPNQENDNSGFFNRLLFRGRGRGRNIRGQGLGRRATRGLRRK